MAVSGRRVDVPVITAVAVAMTITISGADEPGAREPNALAYVLGLTIAALLAFRRTWPMGVLAASAGVLLVYYALGYPAFPQAIALAAAAYVAAAAGHARAAGVLVAGMLLFGAGWQLVADRRGLVSVLSTNVLADAALLAAVVLLGETVRARRALAREVHVRLRRAEEDRRREARQHLEDERLRIARELHDVMAHTIATVNVHAGLAAEAFDDAPEQARGALRTIREQSGEAMSEVRAMVSLLRTEPTGLDPAPGLARLDTLVDAASDGRLHISATVTGRPRRLPSAVDLTAYRIVQESLTNIVRHAGASTAEVHVHYDDAVVVVRVDDDGQGVRGEVDGHGVTGMRERAEALGGAVTAGDRPGGGFRVEARLPTGQAP